MTATFSTLVLLAVTHDPWFSLASVVAIGFCGLYRLFTEP